MGLNGKVDRDFPIPTFVDAASSIRSSGNSEGRDPTFVHESHSLQMFSLDALMTNL
jgi:hypothetical protein